jgi:hypothetical protein
LSENVDIPIPVDIGPLEAGSVIETTKRKVIKTENLGKRKVRLTRQQYVESISVTRAENKKFREKLSVIEVI